MAQIARHPQKGYTLYFTFASIEEAKTRNPHLVDWEEII